MKNLFPGIILAVVLMVGPLPVMAQVNINVNIGLPPPIVFAAPPEVIVLPDTDDVYVVPYIEVDLYFWNGWWWRLWEDHWYRSRYHDRGWAYYRHLPRFYYDVDPSWRVYYREREWRGYRWDYERVPDRRLRQNWSSWRNHGYWQKQKTWGVENYRPLPARQRQDIRTWRQEQSRQRPEVQQYELQRQPRHEPPRQKPQQQKQRFEAQPQQGHGQGQPQHSQPHGQPHSGQKNPGGKMSNQ
jgi:hypothetical protein